MNNIKNKIRANYTQVPNEILTDDSLSWKAKGILTFLMGKTDEQDLQMDEIMKNSTDGMDSLKSGIKELEQKGYLHRERIFAKENGRTLGLLWEIILP